MIMSPQQKENVNLTWKALALVMCGYVGYELNQIKVEIRQSSDFRIEQRGTNRDFEKSLIELKSQKSELATEVKELKTYYYEAIHRNRNQ
jgi:hypothetical protein